eukprot:gene7520-8354_t
MLVLVVPRAVSPRCCLTTNSWCSSSEEQSMDTVLEVMLDGDAVGRLIGDTRPIKTTVIKVNLFSKKLLLSIKDL